jgi:dynein heavy chain, axonemal
MWKALTKASRNLRETAPAVVKVAENAVGRLEGFRKHIGLLHVVCNRGMKERHWAQVSKIVGFHIRPDASSDLSKVRNNVGSSVVVGL